MQRFGLNLELSRQTLEHQKSTQCLVWRRRHCQQRLSRIHRQALDQRQQWLHRLGAKLNAVFGFASALCQRIDAAGDVGGGCFRLP